MRPETLEAVKWAATLASGGLGGAVLTYLLAKQAARRKVKRIAVRENTVEYKLPEGGEKEGFKPLKVAYDGREYGHLSYYTLVLQNGPRRLADALPIILSLAPGSKVIEQRCITKPVSFENEVAFDSSEVDHNLFKVRIPAMRGVDSVEIRLLIDGAKPTWYYRGWEEIEFHRGSKEIQIDLERGATLPASALAQAGRELIALASLMGLLSGLAAAVLTRLLK